MIRPAGDATAAALPRRRPTRLPSLLVTLAMAALAALPCAANEIWFAPRGPEIGGSPDWDQLFKETPAWISVASQLTFYSMTAGYVLRTPDAALRAMAADLALHHVRLSLSAQSVAVRPEDKCGHSEGFSPASESAATADKLARLGIRLDNVTLDGPVWFGLHDDGPQGCHFNIQQVAERVGETLRPYLSHFPDLTIGDIEGLPALVQRPGWQQSYETFLARIAAETGRPISFLQTDDDWRIPDIDRGIVDMAAFARAHGLRFGVIYDGDDLDRSDEAWVDSAIQHFTMLESPGGLIPDQAVFASWNRRPTDALPPTDPRAFSHLVDVYTRPRVRLTATRTGEAIRGRVLDEHGQPVARVPISVQVVGSAPTEPPPSQVATGTVPPQARFAVLGLRVNQECNCAGANDLLIGDFTYAESGAGGHTETYSAAQEALKRHGKPWDGVRVWPVSNGHGLVARAVVPPDQNWGFNSAVFAVIPGAPFTFVAPLGAVGGGGLFGSATIIWLDADRQGLSRTNITLTRDVTQVAQGRTNSEGHFAVTLPDVAALAARPLTVTAAATPSSRGTILELR